MATGQPSEAELRAAYEAEIKKIRIEEILLENIVTLINLGMRRTGLMPGTEDERDPGQVRVAIESVRVQLPLLEESAPEQAAAVRQGLSQLQLAYVQLGGGGAPSAPPGTGGGGAAPRPDAGTPVTEPASPRPPAADPGEPGPAQPGEPGPAEPGEPGPAQRSGRLWVPGQ